MLYYRVSYGQNCMNEFIDYLIKYSAGCLLIGFNSENFDNTFIISALLKKNVKLVSESLMYCNNAILSMHFNVEGGICKVHDLYRFLNSSLDSCCEDYKIENKKTEFNHLKMKEWCDVETYKEEVKSYLIMDVMSLHELYIKFNDSNQHYELFNN